jgi:putative hydrolase of the HAD superfamily
MGEKGVLFWDFDGTLGFGPHGPGGWAPCLVEALDELHPGHRVTPADVRPFTSNRYPWSRPDVIHTHLRTASEWWAALELVFVEAFRGVGYNETAATLATRAGELYADGSRWGLFDDTLVVLDELAAQGWRHVVLSNNIPQLRANLEALGLGRLLDAVVCSADIGYEKPHPAAYRCALEVAGDPAIRWMIGDNFKADVAGAEQAGIPAILVRKHHSDAERVAEDLAGAARFVAAESIEWPAPMTRADS